MFKSERRIASINPANPAFLSALLICSPLPVLAAEHGHQHHETIEEVVVTGPFRVTGSETALPLDLISGEELLEKTRSSLGETLQNEMGIWNGSFGTSVGHPVIRGQSGNRVQILQNSTGVTDVARQSQDHAEGVEVLLAERLEIIRGPATLLYGNGAVGGVINVIDGRIPQSLPEEPQLHLEQSHSTGNSQDQSLIRYTDSQNRLAFVLDAWRRKSGNVEIPGYALDMDAVIALAELREALHEDEHEEEHEDEHEDEELTLDERGRIGNSSASAEGGTFGMSWVTDRGFMGFSVNRLDNNYGLPPGGHAHGHEDEDEHEEDGHDEDEDEHEDEHGDVEFVRIDLGQTRWDFKGQWSFDQGFLKQLDASVGYTDYGHDEVEFFDDGDREVGTRYANSGLEARVTMEHRELGDWTGVLGVQLSDTNFSAVGEEAFIPKSDIQSLGVFLVERFQTEQLALELGARIDRNEIENSCGAGDTAFSLSSNLLYPTTGKARMTAGLSWSERTPSVEELFSNISSATCTRPEDGEQLVLHAATSLFEIGTPNLGSEVSRNLDIGFRYEGETFSGEINGYRNAVSDYIFLQLTGETLDEQLLANWQAEDATFTGLEGKLSTRLWQSGRNALNFTFFGDLVRAEFDSGGQVPRIPPARVGAGLRIYGDSWSGRLNVTRAFDQDRVSALELPTDGYTLVSLYGDYHWSLGRKSELLLFLRANNLLDEAIRNHVSLIKNLAPEPGRNLTLGLRFTF